MPRPLNANLTTESSAFLMPYLETSCSLSCLRLSGYANEPHIAMRWDGDITKHVSHFGLHGNKALPRGCRCNAPSCGNKRPCLVSRDISPYLFETFSLNNGLHGGWVVTQAHSQCTLFAMGLGKGKNVERACIRANTFGCKVCQAGLSAPFCARCLYQFGQT